MANFPLCGHPLHPALIAAYGSVKLAAARTNRALGHLPDALAIALEQAAAWLAGYLEARYGVGGLSNLSPGSLVDWPITEQPKLFSIFGDTERLIGVRLTDSMLMVPRKSISGILFPSEEGFVACQLCDRENCQGRKAPYNGVG